MTDDDNEQVSQNDYVLSLGTKDRKQLRSLPKTHIDATTDIKGEQATVTLANLGNAPAVMLRLNLKCGDGEQILPVIYSDNYLHLMPGESRTINIEWKTEDARGTKPMIEISGTNVSKMTVQ